MHQHGTLNPPPLTTISFKPSIALKHESLLRTQRLQRHAILLLALKRHPELQQLDKHVAEFLEEDPVVLCVPLHMLLEARILDKGHISRQHHERLAPRILVLLRSVPLLPVPLLPQQQAEIII